MAAVGATVLLGACRNLESTVSPTPPRLLVHAILDLAVRDQIILLERARTGTSAAGGSSGAEQAPIGGALVTITTPEGVVMTANELRDSQSPAPAGLYGISLDRYRISLVPGATYVLHVRTPAGEEASGRTTIPQTSPAMSADVDQTPFRRSRDTLRLQWERVPGARRYEVRIRSTSGLHIVFADTSIALPGLARTIEDEPIFPADSPIQMAVSAVDSNYYEYYRSTTDPFAGAPPSRLTGALGVFGAIVPIRYLSFTARE